MKKRRQLRAEGEKSRERRKAGQQHMRNEEASRVAEPATGNAKWRLEVAGASHRSKRQPWPPTAAVDWP